MRTKENAMRAVGYHLRELGRKWHTAKGNHAHAELHGLHCSMHTDLFDRGLCHAFGCANTVYMLRCFDGVLR